MKEIVIVVEGGVVTNVWTDFKTNCCVEIVDLDNLAEEHSSKEAERIAKKRTKGLTQQY